MALFAGGRDGDALTVAELIDIGDRDQVAGLDAADDLDPVAVPLAQLQLAGRQRAALDDEDAVDAVAVLDGGVGNVST